MLFNNIVNIVRVNDLRSVRFSTKVLIGLCLALTVFFIVDMVMSAQNASPKLVTTTISGFIVFFLMQARMKKIEEEIVELIRGEFSDHAHRSLAEFSSYMYYDMSCIHYHNIKELQKLSDGGNVVFEDDRAIKIFIINLVQNNIKRMKDRPEFSGSWDGESSEEKMLNNLLHGYSLLEKAEAGKTYFFHRAGGINLEERGEKLFYISVAKRDRLNIIEVIQ